MPRRVRAAAAVAILIAALLAPAQATDTTAGSCGTKGNTTYSGSATCHLYFRGFPITVWADATVESGAANVRAWLTDDQTNLVALLECSDAGGRTATCDAALPDGVTTLDIENLFFLRCFVEARGTGQYWCQTGQGF